ncbi:hypothetical protein D3C80_140120 [compost metagenome]
MEDFQGQRVGRLAFLLVKFDADRLTLRGTQNIGHVADRLFRREGLLIRLIHLQHRRTGLRQRNEVVYPARCNIADGIFELVLGNAWGFAFRAPDDEVHAGDGAFGEGGIIGGNMPVIDPAQIIADLLTHIGIIFLTRNEDDGRNEAVETVDTRKHAHAWPVAQFHDLLDEADQKIRFDLEEIVARVGFQRVLQDAAGVAVRIEAEMPFDFRDLGAQQGYLFDRARVGGGGEEADDAQFADDIAVLVEAFDADIIHIGAAVHDGFHIGLGDDEEIRAVEEGKDFRGRRHGVLAETQHAHIRIAETAEANAVAAFDLRVLSLAGIGIVTHAEEGEIVIAKPVEEFDRFRSLRLAPR